MNNNEYKNTIQKLMEKVVLGTKVSMTACISYITTKSIVGDNIPKIDNDFIEYLNNVSEILTKDLTNTAGLSSLLAGSAFLASQESKKRILGNLLIISGNIVFTMHAINNNPDPIFLAQNFILSYLSIKSINYELNQNKKIKKDSKIKEFLKTKKDAILNGIKRFAKNSKELYLTLDKQTNHLLSSSLILLSSTFLIQQNIDVNVIMNQLSGMGSYLKSAPGLALTLYGAYNLAKGNYDITGFSWIAANAIWFGNANSDVHQLSTIFFGYTAALMAYNNFNKDTIEKFKEILKINANFEEKIKDFFNDKNVDINKFKELATMNQPIKELNNAT